MFMIGLMHIEGEEKFYLFNELIIARYKNYISSYNIIFFEGINDE